jgi:hypothetical protein
MSLADSPALDAHRILRELTANRVDFVVIGGIAAVLHGSARVTLDLDVCFSTEPENLVALGHTLIALNARLRGVVDPVPFVPDAATLRQVETLTLVTDAGNFDILARPAGSGSYAELRSGSEAMDAGGFTIRVASIDALMAMKSAAGRPKDLVDLAELEAIARLRGA